MSKYRVFSGERKFIGIWSSSIVYNINDVVTGSNNSAYVCTINATSGASYNPTSNETNWSSLVPNSTTPNLTAAYEIRVSTINTTGTYPLGSTSYWTGAVAGEWTIGVSGSTTVTLYKYKSNCNCNCNCNCSYIPCDYYPWNGYCNNSNCSTTVNGYYNLCICVSPCGYQCNCNCTPI